MTHRVVFSEEAIGDVEALFDHLSRRFGSVTATRSVERLLDHCEGFALFPARGRKRDDLRPNLRLVGYRRLATIAFRIDGRDVTILRIFTAGREIAFGSAD